MNQRKKGKKNYKCDACFKIFPSLKDYQKHVSQNIECKKQLPYSCQFCHYIGYHPYGFQKHLQCKPTCNQFYKEKEVTTGQIIDFAIGKVSDTGLPPNQTSYQYNRISASGITDTVQLNLTDNTLSNMDYQTQLDCLSKMKNNATVSSGYMRTGRIISSYTNETLPINQNFQYNHHTDTPIPTELEDNEIFDVNVEQDDDIMYYDTHVDKMTLGIMDIREEQQQMSKRFSSITFTHTDEACMDLFHIMKTSNLPLVIFDRIIRWLKRHEANIATHGTSGIMYRKKFIESMNQKLYSN